MIPSISIRSIEDVCANYAQISTLTRQNPVVITVDGKEDTVLLSYEDYQSRIQYISEVEAKLAVYTHLAQAIDDIKLGSVEPADSAFVEILDDIKHGRV